jgi:competence protein ComEA
MKRIQFSAQEMMGLILLALLLIFQLVYKSIQNERLKENLENTFLSVDFPEGQGFDQSKNMKRTSNSRKKNKQNVKMFAFDPNTLPLDSLQLLGLPYYTAQNLVKYRENGGSIRNRDEMRKIYGMSDSVFKRLEPFIQIKLKNNDTQTRESEKKRVGRYNYSKKAFKGPILLNTTDSAHLDSLPGIGPVLSNRIIKYREALGGFHSPVQLKEVYGITDSTFQNIQNYIQIKDQSTAKIPINVIDFKSLMKHPYCDYEMTRKILNYRKQHGPFQDFSDLKHIYGIDTLALKKLSFYLDFQIPVERKNTPE